MPDTDDIELLKLQAELCKTFADPKRLFIIKELRQGEKSVGQLAEKLGIRPANVSQHLAILRNTGIIDFTRRENYVCYFLKDKNLVKLLMEFKSTVGKGRIAGKISAEKMAEGY